MTRPSPRHPLLAALILALGGAARGQNHVPLFSIDYHGPTIAVPDSALGLPITEGDLLAGWLAAGPLPPPSILYPAGPSPAPNHLNLAWYPSTVGHAPGVMGFVEVDAFSLGLDPELTNDAVLLPGRLFFSVDEFALGVPTGAGPEVATEGPLGEACADVFTNLSTVMLPNPPPPIVPGAHVAVLDGDGLAGASAFAYPGLGLVEANLPQGPPPDAGDDLDALEMHHEDWNALFFSLDSLFVDPHPLMGGQINSGSAFAHGFVGGDVLMVLPGANGPLLFAAANQLGLGLVGGDPDLDDLDALVLRENGTLLFEPPLFVDHWVGGQTDMIFFSVRRGSAVIGMPDSLRGLPIEEGDVLMPPISAAFGGLSPFPAIYVPAEALGLATVRAGTASGASPALGYADDLNALDLLGCCAPLFDCNANGVEDAVDIANGASNDGNGNGVPDECEGVGTPFCFCPAGVCGNADPTAGCANSTGSGGLLSGSGGTSVANDDLVLTGTGLPPNAFNLLFMGPTQGAPLPMADGLRCASGSLRRFWASQADATGTTVYANVVSYANATFPPAGQINPGSTWSFQDWYRDTTGPCGNGSNVTSAVAVTFTP